MKHIIIYYLLLSGFTSYLQENKWDNTLSSVNSEISNLHADCYLLLKNELIWERGIPDTFKIKAKVIKIRNQRNGYIIDLKDVNNLYYYKIVSWKCDSCFGNRIKVKGIYEFEIWAGAPSQIGDITYKQKNISKSGKVIKLSYKIKRRIEVPTFHFTNNLNGLYYIETKK